MNAVKAFDLFLKDHPERAASVQYIIAGREGWHHKEVLQEIKRVNDEWQNKSMAVIRYVGSVNEQEKWSLLQQSVGLLFPSWWEGFGLPVLEAMAVGTPVIASSRGALPEVGGDAAIYVEPDDTEQMALAIAQCVLMPDAMKELKESAKKRAAEFTWERTARETMKVIESV
jgi:glycosyltransferase involved in cell wall biosynthesis